MRPQSSVGFAEKHLQAQAFRQNCVLCSWWRKGDAGTCFFKKTRGERIRSWFRSIDAHDKELISGEMDTVKRSRTPTVVLTANGEVHTHEEAKRFVHDSNRFVTVQLLEETPAVLPPGKLCKDHGYSCEWVSGQEPRLTQNGNSSICKTDNFVPLVVPGISVNSGSSSSSTSLPQESLRPEAEQASGNRAASSSSSGSEFDRSDEQATRRQERCERSVGRSSIFVTGFHR